MRHPAFQATTWTISAIVLFCAFSAAIGAAPSVGATKRILSVNSKIVTGNAILKLEEFAMNDDALTDSERVMEIMEAPAEKQSKNISIIDLAYALRQHPALRNIRLQGARDIQISREFNNQYVDKAKRDIVDYLKQSSPWKEWKIEVLIKDDDMRRIAKLGAFERLEVLNRDSRATLGPIDLRVVFLDKDKKRLQEFDINPIVLREVFVAVVAETLEKGHAIGANDIKMAPVMLGQERRDYILDMKGHFGKELKRTARVGDYLCPDDLLDPVCARRGDIIKVACKLGGMQVTTIAKAMQGGRKGELIRAQNLTSSKVITVTLTEEREGVIQL